VGSASDWDLIHCTNGYNSLFKYQCLITLLTAYKCFLTVLTTHMIPEFSARNNHTLCFDFTIYIHTQSSHSDSYIRVHQETLQKEGQTGGLVAQLNNFTGSLIYCSKRYCGKCFRLGPYLLHQWI
jgi:hypothetical protein